MKRNSIYLIIFIMLIILFGVLLRLCVSLHPYSGQNKPPMYGDYEAQRHWMEITYNLPIREWYFNTTDNELMYWGLDYPPLTAYHSWVCGHVASCINSSFVELHTSRGFETDTHKHFMRFTVIIADMITFIPAIVLFFIYNKNTSVHRTKEYLVSNNEVTKLSSLLALIYPGIILIDHGHFQYNCISLGLFVFAVFAIKQGRHFTASVLFCSALAYKQMELYHAFPFFFYLLGHCFYIFKRRGLLSALYKLTSLGVTVFLTLTLICFPFITDFSQAQQLLIRLFPIARGVFEDKVANVWCVINIFYKLKVLLSNENMAKICAAFTCMAVIPSCYDLFINNSVMKFKYSLINCALSFFLFSYQVHEKTILLAGIPVLLVLPYDPLPCVWFLCISVFSMYPLLLKDQLVLPYVSLNVLFIFTFLSCSFNRINKSNESNIIHKGSTFQFIRKNVKPSHLFYFSLFGCLILSVCITVIKAPKKYPDLFPLLISVYSCLHFLGFLFYFNIRQFYSRTVKGKID